MAYLNPRIYDNGLTVLSSEANALHICTTEPTTYTEAVTTYTIGNKASPIIAAPTDRTGGGREVVVSAISDGSVTAAGTPNFVAIVDTVNLRLLMTGALTTTEAMLNGDTFTINQFAIGIPLPA